MFLIADAPWEDDVPRGGPVVADRDEVRCQGALDYRVAILENPPTLPSRAGVSFTDLDALQQLLDQAEREIRRYC